MRNRGGSIDRMVLGSNVPPPTMREQPAPDRTRQICHALHRGAKEAGAHHLAVKVGLLDKGIIHCHVEFALAMNGKILGGGCNFSPDATEADAERFARALVEGKRSP